MNRLIKLLRIKQSRVRSPGQNGIDYNYIIVCAAQSQHAASVPHDQVGTMIGEQTVQCFASILIRISRQYVKFRPNDFYSIDMLCCRINTRGKRCATRTYPNDHYLRWARMNEDRQRSKKAMKRVKWNTALYTPICPYLHALIAISAERGNARRVLGNVKISSRFDPAVHVGPESYRIRECNSDDKQANDQNSRCKLRRQAKTREVFTQQHQHKNYGECADQAKRI